MLTGHCSPAADDRPILQVQDAGGRAGIHGCVHPARQPRNEQAVKLTSLVEREFADLVAVYVDRRDLLDVPRSVCPTAPCASASPA